MMPSDANPSGNVFGGSIMKLVDQVGGIVAAKHSQSRVVTASVDRLDFLAPVYIGDVVTLIASLTYIGKTSMEVGVRIESDNPITGEHRHTGSCYLTYVAFDEAGKPKLIPQVTLETEEEKKIWQQGAIRKQRRLSQMGRFNLPG